MKNILLPIIGTIVFIIFVGFLTQRLQTKAQPAPKQIKIGAETVNVEIADTEAERMKGLSGRSSLAENEGMLFVFGKKKVFPSFWMRNMLISIDIIWIADGKISKIDKNVPIPPPNTPDSQLALYYPDKPIDYVLEVPAGFSDKNNIKVGDSVDLSKI